MTRDWRTRSVALTLALLLAWPALGRVWIECVDGTPCARVPAPVVKQPHECCKPKPCHTPVEKQCVVRSEPAPLCVLPQAAPVVAPPELLAIVTPIVIVDLAPASASSHAVEAGHPPNLPAPPKQGRAPRAPPAHA